MINGQLAASGRARHDTYTFRLDSKRFWSTIAILVAFCVTALAGAADGFAQEEKKKKKRGKATVVIVDEVRQEPLAQTMPVLGRFIALRSGVVAAHIGGPVKKIFADVGDRVEAGKIIAELDTDMLKWRYEVTRAEMSEAEARVRTAKVRVKLLSQELKRLTNLRKSAAFSQARFEDKQVEVSQAKSQVVEAEAAMKRRKAAMELTHVELENAKIRAPYTGVITRRHTEIGSYVKEGDQVFNMVDDNSLEIEADVPSKRIAGLSAGLKLRANIDSQTNLEASVRAIVPSENPLARTRMVRFTASFKDKSQALAANQSVTLHIPISKIRDIVTVHKDAVINRMGKNVVFVVQKRRARLKEVVLGDSIGNRFEVIRGLEPEDKVVIRGNERLKDGRRVKTESPAS
ncbi:MAG: efflux RND transporter periplasmic adaptor subunit [Rhodospirillales bacterium]